MKRNKANFLKPASFQPSLRAVGPDSISCPWNLLGSARLFREHHCPDLGGMSHRKKIVKCCRGHYNQVGLQQQRENIPLPAVPIKSGLARSEQPVSSCSSHQKRGWSSVKLNCKHRGDPAEFVGLLMGCTRDMLFVLTPPQENLLLHYELGIHLNSVCAEGNQASRKINWAVDWCSLELMQLSKGFVEMRKPKRDLLRSGFKLCQTCSPWLRAARTNCSQQVAVVIRERQEEKKTQRTSKQKTKHEFESDSLTLTAYSYRAAVSCSVGCLSPLCPARPTEDPFCQASVTEPPKGFHPQPSLVAGLTFLPARRGAHWPRFATLSACPGHIFCLKQGWVAGHNLHFSFTSKILLLTISNR